MWICTRAFHVAKQGNADTEYEDAFYPEGALRCERADFRCAVADGASESAFAQQWARMLVRSFGRRRLRLERLRRLWTRLIKGKPLPWYLEKKIRHGAHATLLGLSIHDAAAPAAHDDAGPGAATTNGDGRVWRALAVGDSCLFQVRGDELVVVGPLSSPDEFGNTPHLLSSRATEPIRRSDQCVRVLSGAWQPGDRFYLVTDALAQWLLSEIEAGQTPWEFLRELDDEATKPFDQLIGEMRSSHGLHNDDTTLLRVEVTE